MSQRQYILNLLARTGWSQTELAKRAGLDPSTLSRFLSNIDETHALRSSTIKRLELVSGIAYVDRPTPKIDHETGLWEVEATPFLPAKEDDVTAAFSALHRGSPNQDVWVLRSRALELVGYRPDDFLLVNLDVTPLRGDIVCAQVYDWTSGRAQTVFRIYAPPILTTATTNLELTSPLTLEDNRVIVKGVVVAMIRTRSASSLGFSEG